MLPKGFEPVILLVIFRVIDEDINFPLPIAGMVTSDDYIVLKTIALDHSAIAAYML